MEPGPAVVALLCAAAAAGLAWPPVAGRLRPAVEAADRLGARALQRVLRLGPDSVALRTRLVVAVALSALAVQVGGRVGVPPGALVLLAGVLAVGATVGLGHLEPGRVRRRRERLVRDLPAALDLLAACLSAGLPLRAGVAAVRDAYDGPLADELGGVLALVELGVPEADAWRTLRGHPQLGGVAGDLARSVESGTMLVEALVARAADARQARHAALEAAAKAVGVRSVLPMMVCFLPAFLLLGIVPTVVSAFANALPF